MSLKEQVLSEKLLHIFYVKYGLSFCPNLHNEKKRIGFQIFITFGIHFSTQNKHFDNNNTILNVAEVLSGRFTDIMQIVSWSVDD